MPLHVLDHPLAAHILTHLRDRSTKPATFRTLAYQLSLLLAIEATSDLATEEKSMCIVAAPEGVAAVEKQHPGTVIHTAALDRALNAKKYILPGLGDFGDRLYGT